MVEKLIDLESFGQNSFQRQLLGLVRSPLECLFLLDDINDLYSEIAANANRTNFFQSSLASLGNKTRLEEIASSYILSEASNGFIDAISTLKL